MDTCYSLCEGDEGSGGGLLYCVLNANPGRCGFLSTQSPFSPPPPPDSQRSRNFGMGAARKARQGTQHGSFPASLLV